MHVAPPYRADIDGLRAVAVLAVVGFHAFPTLVKGGFVGVDVFFVVSGYLISAIVLGALTKDRFSFTEFYARRIRRIFPALIVVLIAGSVLGFLLLYSFELRALGKDTFFSALFLSNAVSWLETGYFDPRAGFRPLLHLWSLGVEEQFYIVWPFLLWLFWQKEWDWGILLIAGVVLSFSLSVLTTYRAPSAAFYFPVTRLWELSAGGLLAYMTLIVGGAAADDGSERKPDAVYPRPWRGKWLSAPTVAEIFSLSGLLLVAAAVSFVDRASSFPGWWALLPTAGAWLLIAAGPNASLNHYLLASRPLVYIGLISYPLYLWHWVLLSFLGFFDFGRAQIAVVAATTLVSVALAGLTYRFVEVKIRSSRGLRYVGLLSAGLCVVGAYGGVQFLLGYGRLSSSRDIGQASGDWTYPGRNGKAVVVGKGPVGILFTGDSHIEQYWPRVNYLIDRMDHAPAVTFFTDEGCPPLPHVNRFKPGFDCEAIYRAWTGIAARADIKSVVLGAYWEIYFIGGYDDDGNDGPLLYKTDESGRAPMKAGTPQFTQVFEELARELSNLRSSGKRIYIVLSNPTSRRFSPMLFLPDRISGAPRDVATSIVKSDFEAFNRPINEALRRLAKESGAELIDPVADMCPTDVCSVVGARGLPIYRDSNHMRASWARDNAKFMDRVFDELRPCVSAGC